MKIEVRTDDGVLIDAYHDVSPSDIESPIFGAAIRRWLIRTLTRGISPLRDSAPS